MRTLRMAFLSSLVLELLATLSVALVAVGIGLRLVTGSLDLRTALLVLILAPEAYLPLRAMVGAHFHASADGLAAAATVFAVLDTPVPRSGTRRAIPRRAPVTAGHRDRPVSPAGPSPRSTDFQLTVNPGEIVALTGPSGAGKSTVLHLLLGFVTPQSGRVTVGGSICPTWIRPCGGPADRLGAAAAVPVRRQRRGQHPARPAGRSRPHGTAPRAGRARSTCSAAAVGEGGAGLSAGQRQRVALARASCPRRAAGPARRAHRRTSTPATEAEVLATIPGWPPAARS